MDTASIASSVASGSAATADDDFLTEFRNISNKLKRRFLRRPNVAEANELYTRLAKRLRNDEEPQYEALCHLAVARCEQSAGNPAAEAEALVAASRSFLRAERKVQHVGCPSFEEHLTAAVHSYNHAIRLLEEGHQADRAAGLCLEVADALRAIDRDRPGQQGHPERGHLTGQALAFYQRAADLRSSTILEYMQAREKVAECHLDSGDLHNAVTVLTEVAGMADQYGGRPSAESVYADILARCEVSRVLLLLLIEPNSMSSSLPPDLTAVLDKYSWESEDVAAAEEASRFLSEEVFLLLQSLVMAVQIRDGVALRELEDFLAPLLSRQPRTLLRGVVKNMQTKPPT